MFIKNGSVESLDVERWVLDLPHNTHKDKKLMVDLGVL
jgi:hypothetical protein